MIFLACFFLFTLFDRFKMSCHAFSVNAVLLHLDKTENIDTQMSNGKNDWLLERGKAREKDCASEREQSNRWFYFFVFLDATFNSNHKRCSREFYGSYCFLSFPIKNSFAAATAQNPTSNTQIKLNLGKIISANRISLRLYFILSSCNEIFSKEIVWATETGTDSHTHTIFSVHRRFGIHAIWYYVFGNSECN